MNLNNLIDNCFLCEDVEVIAKEYNRSISVVGLQYTKILLRIGEAYPNKSYEWYKEEVKRRTEVYFKCYK
jgi:hypothetical protein